jgi:hypothetical protein
MKTILLTVLPIAILLSFSACKKDEEKNNEEQIEEEHPYYRY